MNKNKKSPLISKGALVEHSFTKEALFTQELQLFGHS